MIYMNSFYNKNTHQRHSGPDPESLQDSKAVLKPREILKRVQDDVKHSWNTVAYFYFNKKRHSRPDPESLQDSKAVLKPREILKRVQDDVGVAYA